MVILLNWMNMVRIHREREIISYPSFLDYWIDTVDNFNPVRFHATLPPPNNHTHGYWHVYEPLNIRPQNDSVFDVLPPASSCLPDCGLDSLAVPSVGRPIARHIMPWTAPFDEKHIAKLTAEYAALSSPMICDNRSSFSSKETVDILSCLLRFTGTCCNEFVSVKLQK